MLVLFLSTCVTSNPNQDFGISTTSCAELVAKQYLPPWSSECVRDTYKISLLIYDFNLRKVTTKKTNHFFFDSINSQQERWQEMKNERHGGWHAALTESSAAWFLAQ